MSTLPEPPSSSDGPRPGPALPSGERRRLLRGSLAAGPVLMTVMSRPVLGQVQCGNQSVQASLAAGTSLHPGCASATISTGYAPNYWSSRTSSWPSPYCATTIPGHGPGNASTWSQTQFSSTNTQTATPFHSPTTGFQGTVFGTHTMLDVLKQNAGGAGYGTLGMYCAAALLNAASGRTPFLSEASVQRMWNDNLLQGYYEPTPGIRWGATQIIAYLQSTMH